MEESNQRVKNDERYQREVSEMRRLGKYELQWMYGQQGGGKYLTEGYLLRAILRADYI